MKKFDVQIDKYGVSLAVKDGQFYIKSKDHRQSVPANKIRQITMTKSTSITGAAVQLALDNEIDISFVHKDQMPYARIWNSKFGSISTIRRNQLSFSESIDGSLWIKDVIKEKIKNQMTLIFKISKNVDSPSVQNFRDKMASYLYKIDQSQNSDALILANQLRGWEANASKLFFSAISACLPLQWKFKLRSRRPAMDAFNAVLNYSYGILYNKIEGLLIRAGLDPHIGVFHKDQYNRPVLVYDIIEIFRHWAEYPVIMMFQNDILMSDYFTDLKPGININRSGKKIIIEIIMSFYNEKIEFKGNRAKRIVHIKSYIQDFSSQMKDFKHVYVKKSGI